MTFFIIAAAVITVIIFNIQKACFQSQEKYIRIMPLFLVVLCATLSGIEIFKYNWQHIYNFMNQHSQDIFEYYIGGIITEGFVVTFIAGTLFGEVCALIWYVKMKKRGT